MGRAPTPGAMPACVPSPVGSGHRPSAVGTNATPIMHGRAYPVLTRLSPESARGSAPVHENLANTRRSGLLYTALALGPAPLARSSCIAPIGCSAMIQLRTFGALDLRGQDGTALQSVLAQPKRFALL